MTIASLAPSAQGKALIDAHTPLHAVVGFAAGVLGIDPHLAVAMFIGARIVEASLKEGAKHALFRPEAGQSLGNEMTDLLVEIAGLHAGEALRARLVGAESEQVSGLGHYHHQHAVSYPYSLRIHP